MTMKQPPPMPIERMTLHNGLVVLAGTDRYGYWGAVTYKRAAPAAAKVEELTQAGIPAHVYRWPWTRVRFIVLANAPTQP
jgi:hypothetical protein